MQKLLFFAKCAGDARGALGVRGMHGLHRVHGVHGVHRVHRVHGELDIELNSRIKEKLMDHLNLINGLLGKKTQEMARKKLTNGVKNSLKVEENSGMV